MSHFADRLIKAIKDKSSPICVGLDPRLKQIPAFIKDKYLAAETDAFKAAAESIIEFNKGIIDAVFDLVPIVKPQMAFYEQYGAEGTRALLETVKYAKTKGLLVLLDGKRNDIDSTAEAYANTYLGKVDLFGEAVKVFDADALTINPSLGFDGVNPFVEVCRKYGKGIFVLVKTSNKSSGEFQDLLMKHENLTNYQVIANFVESWGADDVGSSGYNFIGAVVGATFPKEAAILRKLMPNTIFLVPGYGAQGATADDLKGCFNADGTGAIINNSRGIIFAYEKRPEFGAEKYKEAARKAVEEMKEELQKIF